MAAQPDKSIRVLVADDDEFIRDILCEFVGRFYECTSVGSAEEALELLGRETFNLIVCDVTMSGMTGLEMVPRVRALAPETVCVMISGAQAVETAVEALRVGAFDYLTKPFDLSQVEAVVRRAVEHQKLLATKRRYELFLEEAIRERTAQLDETLALLEDAYRTTLRALVAALEMRDTDTHGHSERVVSFSLRLGRECARSNSDRFCTT
jgi:cyclic di-GMP phosphodiesterase